MNTIFTVTHFRRVVFDISRRAKELPAAGKLSLSISEMRLMLSGVKGSRQAEQRVKSRLEVNASQEIVRRLELFDFSQQRDFNSYSLLLQKEAEYIASIGSPAATKPSASWSRSRISASGWRCCTL